MKINELINESVGTITTYLAILGHDINYYENGCISMKNQYRNNPTEQYKVGIKIMLSEINFKLINLIADQTLWERFQADPEIEQVYNKLVNLYNANEDYIKSLT